MQNASIKEEVRWQTIKVVTTSSWFRCNNNMVLYDMHKKGFIDMVKGLLAWFLRVFKSSGPSPSSPSASSTNVGNNHNKQHNKAKMKVLQNVSWTFLGYLWSYEEWPKWFHWDLMNGYLWTFQYDGIKGFMDLQEVYRNIFLKNEQRHPFNKPWF